MSIKGKTTEKQRAAYIRQEVESKGYTLHNQYINAKTKLCMTCPKGHPRECLIASFRKYNCNACVSYQSVQVLVDKIELDGYRIVERPDKASGVLTAICKNGHTRVAKINNFLNHGCVECQGSMIKFNIEFCRDLFESRGFTLLEDSYVNCKTFMKYRCSCGEIRETNLDIIRHSDIKSCEKCKGKVHGGENHYNWKGGITSENVRLRNTEDYADWRNKVFKRDSYTCQCCWQLRGDINAHHIFNFSEHVDIRHEVTNGITLCYQCHSEFHIEYGNQHNDLCQLQEYFNNTAHEPVYTVESILQAL